MICMHLGGSHLGLSGSDTIFQQRVIGSCTSQCTVSAKEFVPLSRSTLQFFFNASRNLWIDLASRLWCMRHLHFGAPRVVATTLFGHVALIPARGWVDRRALTYLGSSVS